MHYVLVLMVVAIAVILACVVIVATGRGGEMARFPNDYAAPDFSALAATDVALLRPPTTLWGYNMQATNEALTGIAAALSARDVRIASLERQIADLRAASQASPYGQMPGSSARGARLGTGDRDGGTVAKEGRGDPGSGWPGGPSSPGESPREGERAGGAARPEGPEDPCLRTTGPDSETMDGRAADGPPADAEPAGTEPGAAGREPGDKPADADSTPAGHEAGAARPEPPPSRDGGTAARPDGEEA